MKKSKRQMTNQGPIPDALAEVINLVGTLEQVKRALKRWELDAHLLYSEMNVDWDEDRATAAVDNLFDHMNDCAQQFQIDFREHGHKSDMPLASKLELVCRLCGLGTMQAKKAYRSRADNE